MRHVLDTNVVSALRVRGRNPSVENWSASVEVVDQFVTAMTISEIERGVIAKERSDPAQGRGPAPLDDALIGAVAQAAGMIVVTRHSRHFESLGVAYVDPWA